MAKKPQIIEDDDPFGVGDGLTVAEADASGNTYLPGAAPVVVQEIVDLVMQIENDFKPAFIAASEALNGARAELSAACHRNIEHFTPLDDSNTRSYSVALDGQKIEVKITLEKEKIKTKLSDAPGSVDPDEV